MKKVFRVVSSGVFVTLFSGFLFYCMVAGAGRSSRAGTIAYVIMAAVLSIGISVSLCVGFCHIQKLQKQLREMEERAVKCQDRRNERNL